MSIHVTEGALKKILSGVYVEQPVLKILNHRVIRDQHERRRYQLFITDNIIYTSLAVIDFNIKLIEIVQTLKKNWVAQIINYSINDLMSEGKHKYVMVIKEMFVIPTKEIPRHCSGNTAPSTSDMKFTSISNKLPKQVANNVTGKLRPISKLIPTQVKQIIKARVTDKSQIVGSRYYKETFSAELQDESGIFTIIGNGDKVKFFDMIQVNKTYYFVGVYVRFTENNSIALYFQSNTLVIPLEHDDEESVTNLDRSPAYSYTLKECYIASENGIDRFNSYGTVIDICTAQCPYKACTKCKKKVTKDKSGNYSCSQCKESFIPRDKTLLTINIGDSSYMLQKVILCDEVVEKFLEVKTEKITRYVWENNANYWKIFNNVIYKPYQFKLKNKSQQNYLKYKTLKSLQVVSVEKPNYKQRCIQLLTEIKIMYAFWRSYVQYIIEQRLKEDLSSIQNLDI